AIPLFSPPIPHSIQDDDVYFEECITEINKRLRDYGTLYPDSLEAMRNEYVVAILHTALHIFRDETKKEFSMRLQQEIIGEESSGRVDYAIKASESAYTIEFNKKSLDKDSEECQALHKNVKKVLEMIVGLLKDRACVEKSPANDQEVHFYD
ncbi:6895_t:CDS:2, partial [Ambispora leptoticha]